MVQLQTSPLVLDFADKRRARGYTADVLVGTAYGNIASLRTTLFGISATKYSQARLDAMTANDLIYALRMEVDLAGVK